MARTSRDPRGPSWSPSWYPADPSPAARVRWTDSVPLLRRAGRSTLDAVLDRIDAGEALASVTPLRPAFRRHRDMRIVRRVSTEHLSNDDWLLGQPVELQSALGLMVMAGAPAVGADEMDFRDDVISLMRDYTEDC